MALSKIKKHGGKIKGAGGDGTARPGDPPQQTIQKYPLYRGLPKMPAPPSGVATGYGSNQYAGPSSAAVGDVESDYAGNMNEDDTLEALEQGGGVPNAIKDQTRDVGTSDVKTVPGQKNQNTGPIKASR